MQWSLDEAMEYYQRQGAPADQNALIALLKEIQKEQGNISPEVPERIAQFYGVRSALVQALIRRIPGLRLGMGHCLELCGGKNCAKAAALAEYAKKHAPGGVAIRTVGCMRLCGKGPNLRWDGKLYHKADTDLIDQLMRDI